MPYAGLRSGCAGCVSRTWRQEEQGRFLRLLALANETADELLSRPACSIRFYRPKSGVITCDPFPLLIARKSAGHPAIFQGV